MMANGIAAGFTNSREVWFSAAYLPHAWPAAYAITVPYPVVGLTANGSSLNIICQGPPSIATGVTPDTMTVGEITSFEPCIGRGSIVASGEGAYYASPNGLQLLNTGGTQNMTLPVMEKEYFNNLQPSLFCAGRYGAEYVGFVKGANIPATPSLGNDGDENGFVIAVQSDQSPNQTFSFIDTMTPVVNCYPDQYTGNLYYITNNQVYQWNPPIGNPSNTTLKPWKWKTKKFRFTYPQEFAAFLVLFDVPPEVTFTPGARNTSQSQTYNPSTQWLIVRVYADDRQIVVREIQVSGEVLLIPGGFKATLWQIQFEGMIAMKFYKMASSVKELRAT
jgi:hypothetical protein